MKVRLFFTCLIMLLYTSLYSFSLHGNQLEMKEAGTYPVKAVYTSPKGDVIEETYYITIVYLRTTVDETIHEAIDAYDIKIYDKNIDELSQSEIIQLAKAKAWDTKTGESIPIVKVDINKRDESTYQIVFTTEKGTETTIMLIKMDAAIPESIVEMEVFYIEIPEVNNYRLFGIVSIGLIVVPLLLLGLNYLRLQQQAKNIWELLHDKKGKV